MNDPHQSQPGEGIERVHRALERFPGHLAEVGRLLLASRPTVELDAVSLSVETAWGDAERKLDAMSSSERQAIFAAILPRLAAYLETLWQRGKSLPYMPCRRTIPSPQDGDPPFRAPRRPAASLRLRGFFLRALTATLADSDPDVVQLAHRLPLGLMDYLVVAHALGSLFAVAIDQGGPDGEAVLARLRTEVERARESGHLNTHVMEALLMASRPEGWEEIERLLQDSPSSDLRWRLLGSASVAHPEAFRRILQQIRTTDRTRFPERLDFLVMWLDIDLVEGDRRYVDGVLECLERFLRSPEERTRGLESGDAETAYLALWALACEDADAAVAAAMRFLPAPSVEYRFIATHLLGRLDGSRNDWQSRIPRSVWSEPPLPGARAALLVALDDADLRVVAWALDPFMSVGSPPLTGVASDLFERLEGVFARAPAKPTQLAPVVWPWAVACLDRQMVGAALVTNLGERSPAKLLPYLHGLASEDRRRVVEKIAAIQDWDAETRGLLLTLAGDRAASVRGVALATLNGCTLTEAEARLLETSLSREAEDLRQGVLTLLLLQTDARVLASVDRLLSATNLRQRRAGIEMLRWLGAERRLLSQCAERAREYLSRGHPIESEDERQLRSILGRSGPAPTLEDALGLARTARRTRPVAPVRREVSLATEAAVACLRSLWELIDAHHEERVSVETKKGVQRMRLGKVVRGFPRPRPAVAVEEDETRLPLRELWEDWWRGRSDAERDADGFELLRSLAPLYSHGYFRPFDRDPLLQPVLAVFYPETLREYACQSYVTRPVLEWLLRLHPPAGAADFLLDAVETVFALLPASEVSRVPAPRYPDRDWREMIYPFTDAELADSPFMGYLHVLRLHQAFHSAAWSGAQHVHLWRLLRWRDEPLAATATAPPRCRPLLAEALLAYEAGSATEADLFDHLLGPPDDTPWTAPFADLHRLTGQEPEPEFGRYPFLRAIVERCRERILEVELDRGEAPTAASRPAMALRSAGASEILARVLQALGRAPLYRGRDRNQLTRAAVFSHLLRITSPIESDTPEAFALRMCEAGIPSARLRELAEFAPQWAEHIAYALR